MRGITRNGHFYNDTVKKGKEALTDGREVVEKTENTEEDAVLQ